MEQDFVVIYPTVLVDIKTKEKNEHKKTIVWENGKHLACHSE